MFLVSLVQNRVTFFLTCSLGVAFKRGIIDASVDKFTKIDLLVTCCSIGSKEFIDSILERFVGQVIFQMLVSKTNFFILLKLSEIGVLDIVVMFCTTFYLQQDLNSTRKKFENSLCWAHQPAEKARQLTLPSFSSKESKSAIANHLIFLQGLNEFTKKLVHTFHYEKSGMDLKFTTQKLKQVLNARRRKLPSFDHQQQSLALT